MGIATRFTSAPQWKTGSSVWVQAKAPIGAYLRRLLVHLHLGTIQAANLQGPSQAGRRFAGTAGVLDLHQA